MKLLIKQRVFAWGDTYDIYDADGNVKYVVKAEIFSFGHQLHVYDANGNEVGEIKQKLFTFLPKFAIVMHGMERGTITQNFTIFNRSYDVDFNGWSVEGDFFGWDYDVYQGSSPIIHITKEWFHWGDTYVIDFENPEDELMGMMLVIAIDAANCSNSNNHH